MGKPVKPLPAAKADVILGGAAFPRPERQSLESWSPCIRDVSWRGRQRLGFWGTALAARQTGGLSEAVNPTQRSFLLC